MWGEDTQKGLNYCLLPCARTDEELGSLAIADLLLTRTAFSLYTKVKKGVTYIGVEAKMHLPGLC